MSPIWPNCGYLLWSCSSVLPGELVDAVTPGQQGANTDDRPRWRGLPNADRASRAGNSGTGVGRSTLCRAMEWWTQRPYSVLPACGARVNGVEIPAPHEQRALAQSRRRGGHDDGLDHDPTLGNNRAGVPARRRVAEALQDGTGRSERCSCPWHRAARHPGDASRPQHLFSLVAEVEP